MKKRNGWMISLLAVLLACLLALLGACAKEGDKEAEAETESSPAAEEAKSGYDEMIDGAFAGKGTLQLIPAEMQLTEEQTKELKPVSLSPDGKTLLCTRKAGEEATELCLVREGQVTPVRLASEKGAGDPNGTMELYTTRVFEDLPPRGGEISWSADGRYATFSSLAFGTRQMSTDVPVLDTEAGELWLADTYASGKEAFVQGDPNAGIVYICKISRKGDYLYYLSFENGGGYSVYRFRRCRPDGSGKEMLYELVKDDDQLFDINSDSVLYEAADGSWLLLGMSGSSRNIKLGTIAMVRFSASEGEGPWNAELNILGNINTSRMYAGKAEVSPVSGYGAFCLHDKVAGMQSNAAKATADALAVQQVSPNAYTSHINLLRIKPGADFPCDVWYLQPKGEDPADLEFVSADEFLQYLQGLALGIEVKIEWFDPIEYLRKGIPQITNLCLSPDGRYALLHVSLNLRDVERMEEKYRLYMVNLETLDLLPVEAPEGIGNMYLSAGTSMATGFWPGMVWNSDGTLLIMSENEGVKILQLTVKEPGTGD